MNQDFKDWLLEVEQEISKISQKINERPQNLEKCNGFYVWDSQYVESPKIMFLGINPGWGGGTDFQINVNPYSRLSYIDHLDEEYSYPLARETVEAFKIAGYSEDEIRSLFENDCVKSNFHYIVTRNQGDMNKCFTELNDYSGKDYWQQSYIWTSELISFVNPKVIICEGKSVFNYLMDDMFDFNEDKFVWENSCGFSVDRNGLVILGYERSYSGIKNKEALAELIQRFTKK